MKFVVLISFEKIKDLLSLPKKDDFLDIDRMWKWLLSGHYREEENHACL